MQRAMALSWHSPPAMFSWQPASCLLQQAAFLRSTLCSGRRALVRTIPRELDVSPSRRSIATQAAPGSGTMRFRSKNPSAPKITTPPDVQEYWQKIIEGVDKPTARKLADKLDLTHPLGLRLQPRGKRPPLYQYTLDRKREHPTHVLLVRIGEFYETMGTDAVLLVQYAGLNPMGNYGFPRAGCPVMNIRRTLHDLVEQAGLTVVVCEESPAPYRYGSRSSHKQRYVAGIVSPAQPVYLHGLVDDAGDAAQRLDTSPPVLGIAASVGGYQVMELNVDMRTCKVTQGLTEDAVSARLHQGGLAPPLYVHSSVHGRSSGQLKDASVETEWVSRVSQLVRSQVGSVKKYSDEDAVKGLIDIVKRDLGIEADAVFRQLGSDTLDRPKALFHSTASQLGIHPTRGIPSLLDAVLPNNVPLVNRRYMRRLLLLPPPSHVAASIRAACLMLSKLKVPLPAWTILPSNHVVRMINARETNEVFFRDLTAVLSAVQTAIIDPQLRPLAEHLMPAVVLESGLQFDLDSLAQGCRNALASISAVVLPEPDFLGTVSDEDESGGESSGGLELLGEFFQANEEFRNKVQLSLIASEQSAVEEAGECVERELDAVFTPLEAKGRAGDLLNNRPSVKYDKVNNAVWIRLIRGSKSHQAGMEMDMINPHDRNGKAVKEFSTKALEEALDAYRAACANARLRVREQLQNLAGRMQGSTADLVGAMTMAVVASTLDAHVREAADRRWALPLQLPRSCPEVSAQSDSTDCSSRIMRVEGMWPYWLDARSRDTVRNTFDLSSMVILTGPNMAGKSTVMRSLCAVAVLSACGLHAPITAATVPYTDAFMLRTFSADSPLEGKSSFAIEMTEMRHVMEDVSSNSLVLVDELGKGTEGSAGAAIAGAMLEELDAKHCRGIFATHLHQLLDMKQLRFSNVQFMCMETQEGEPSANGQDTIAPSPGVSRRVPTWRMVPGKSRESLALEVALQNRVPAQIVERAAALYQSLMAAPTEATTSQAGEPTQVAPASPATSARSRWNAASLLEDSAASLTGRPIEEAAAVLVEAARPILDQLDSSQVSAAQSSESDLQPEGGSQSQAEVQATMRSNGLFESAPELANGDAGSNGACRGMAASEVSWGQLNGAVNGHANGFAAAELETQVVRAGQVPPPSTVGCSCVYILRRPDGYFYCGETDDIKGRLATHRRKSSVVKGGAGMEAAYLQIPTSLQGKSAATAVEAQAIRALQQAGFPLLSVTDSRRKRAPKGAG